MPVILRHNEELELNRVEYSGSVTLAELDALARFQAANPTWLTYDVLSLVPPGAHFSTVDLSELDRLFANYRKIFAPLTFLILRRSAWLCQSPAAERHVRHWIGERDTKAGMATDARMFESYATAGEWLVLNPAEIAILERAEGFSDIFNADSALGAAPTR